MTMILLARAGCLAARFVGPAAAMESARGALR